MMKEHRYVLGILFGLPLLGLLLAAIAVNAIGSCGRSVNDRAPQRGSVRQINGK
jgi:hypothetical protein